MKCLNHRFQDRDSLYWFYFFLWLILGMGWLVPPDVIAQGVIQSWVAGYNGPGNGNDNPVKVVTDAFGNLYVTGSSSNGSNSDIATIKYDTNGNQIWLATYDSGGYDSPSGLAVDSSGNVYVTGLAYNGLYYNFATIKYDTNGNQLWIAWYGNGAYDSPSGIAVDSSGNVYVTGISYNGLNYDFATVKLDASGTQLWVARYDNGGYDSPSGIALDSSGNVYVTGGSSNGFNSDFATVKYDPNGHQLWVARYDHGSDDGSAAIAVDISGNAYVTGSSNNGTNSDYATIKYDTNGNQLWVARYDNAGNDYAIGMVTDTSGNVYVTGNSYGLYGDHFATVKYDSGGNQLWVARYDNGKYFDIPTGIAVDSSGNVYVTGVSELTDNGNDGFATVKYDPSGNQIWVMIYNAGPWNWPSGVALDSTGNVYVTGSSYLTTGNADYATVKYINVPDLVETNVTSPAIGTQQLPGSSISVTDTVVNHGSVSAGGFSVGLFLYPAGTGKVVFLGTRWVSGLAPGGSSTGTTTVKLPSNMPGGTYYLQAVADYSNQIQESDETNNSYTNTTGVITVPPADLIMTSVSTTATSVVRGGTVTLSYTIKNQGISGASAFYLGFYLSTDNTISTTDKLVGAVYFKNGLGAGASYSGTVTLTIPTTVATGSYYLGAYADYSNKVPESNESNNSLATAGAIQVQ